MLTNRLAAFLPLMLGILLLVGLSDALVLAFQFWWPGRIPDDSTSGVWTALAVDYAQGHFYRPVVSDFGYGGTRYMPLYFMYLGTLISYGMDPIIAGIIAMQSTVVATLAGIILVMRRAGVSMGWAVSLALVTYCTTVFQHYVTDTNCEYLATALSLFAFALYLQPSGQRPAYSQLLLIAFLCCLGFFTKLATLYVPAAIFLHLLLSREWRSATLFAVGGIAMLAVLFQLFQHMSDGHMLDNLASAATGGTPLDYVSGFLGRFLKVIVISNPAIGVTALMALAVWIAQIRTDFTSPFVLVFLMVSLSTMLIFTSWGVVGNHVIAFHAFCLVMIGTGLSSPQLRATFSVGFAVLTIISLAALLPGIASPRVTLELPQRETAEQLKNAISRYRHDERPIISNDGAVSTLFDERAVVLDDYNLWIAVTHDPVMAADLKRRLSTKQFSVLALKGPPGHLDDSNYIEMEQVGRFRILIPKIE